MKAITYTAAREGLASAMDAVCRDRSPVIITRNRSPVNARRLLSAIGSLQKGKGRARKIDLEP